MPARASPRTPLAKCGRPHIGVPKESFKSDAALGSGLIDQSQKMTVAAMQMAEKKV